MSTSGTIGNTRINTVKLLEKAARRCGLVPQVLTPEIVESAMESLFMLILGMMDRGLNLWCIDQKIIPLVPGKKTYVLPEGTLDVLNLLYSTPQRLDYTLDNQPTYTSTSFETDTSVVLYGVKFSTLPATSYEFQVSDDGINWVTVETVTSLPSTGEYAWSRLPERQTVKYFRVYSTNLGTVSDLYLSGAVSEIVVTPFNRDDYASQPNKEMESSTVTNYFFEKLVDPQITTWPVPNDDTRFLYLFRYRQIQDIGTLTNELEIPTRWLESVTWEWAARLAFEIPGVEPARRGEVLAMAEKMTRGVEAGETDSSPAYLYPNIRGYTR